MERRSMNMNLQILPLFSHSPSNNCRSCLFTSKLQIYHIKYDFSRCILRNVPEYPAHTFQLDGFAAQLYQIDSFSKKGGRLILLNTLWNFNFPFWLFSSKEPACMCKMERWRERILGEIFLFFSFFVFRFVFERTSLKVWDGDAVEYLGDFRGKEKSAAQRRQSWCYINHPKVDKTVWAINHSQTISKCMKLLTINHS